MNSILAIDPGAKSGIAVVTIEPRPRLLDWSLVNLSAKVHALPSSVVKMVVKLHDPQGAYIEDQFFKNNIRSLKVLSRTSGRWQEACVASGLEVRWVAPNTWQSASLRRAGRTREQIKAAVLALATTETGKSLPQDAADAYCIGRWAAIEQFFGNL